MQFLPFARVAVATFIFAPVCFGQVAQLDISGIKLNMSLEQAKSIIGGGFHEISTQGMDPAITYFVGWNLNEGWALETINNRIVYVEHAQRWTNPDTMPLQAAVKAKLAAKFGGNPFQTQWAFDNSGRLLDVNAASRCGAKIANGDVTSRQVTFYFPQERALLFSNQTEAGVLSFPSVFAPHCPVSLVDTILQINTQHKDIAVSELRISLSDVDAQYQETLKRNAVVQAQKNSADQKRNANRQTAPF